MNSEDDLFLLAENVGFAMGHDSNSCRAFPISKDDFEEFTGGVIETIAVLPSTYIIENDTDKNFKSLVTQWRSETAHLSSATKASMHPAYQRIIGMGPAVIPLLLRELEQDPDHWFWALSAITGEDPIKPEHRGRVKQMAQAWLNWGKENGYRW